MSLFVPVAPAATGMPGSIQAPHTSANTIALSSTFMLPEGVQADVVIVHDQAEGSVLMEATFSDGLHGAITLDNNGIAYVGNLSREVFEQRITTAARQLQDTLTIPPEAPDQAFFEECLEALGAAGVICAIAISVSRVIGGIICAIAIAGAIGVCAGQ